MAFSHKRLDKLADAGLNLPAEKHSHGLRRLAAVEACRGSFDDATNAIARVTGQTVGKRQTEQLAARAAADFETFYATRTPAVCDPGDVLVVSVDGKGTVMRPDALRPATAAAAAGSSTKLSTRLSKGEKRQPQAHGHRRRGLRRQPRGAHPRRRHPPRRRRGRRPGRRPDRDRQVADRLGPRRRRHHHHRPRLRPGRPSRPHPIAATGRTGRRQQPSDHTDHRRSHRPRGGRHDHHRLRARARVPVVGCLVRLPRSRPRRRSLGGRQSISGARRASPAGRHRNPTTCHPQRAGPTDTAQRRPSRRLPGQQGRPARLPPPRSPRAGRSPPE